MTGHNVQLERIAANSDWLPVASALTSLCNSWASRYDLVVYLGRDGGQGKAAAFFDPGRAQIEINSGDAFPGVSGASVGNLEDRMELSKFPVAGGLALHEAMHARFSKSDLVVVQERMSRPSAFEVFQQLEETRIEGRARLLFERDVPYLRASCKSLLMADGMEKWSPRGAAVLLIGRAEVRVLDDADVAPVESWLLAQGWDQSVLDRLREIVGSFLYLKDHGEELNKQIILAEELDRLMPEDPTPDGDEGEGESGSEALVGAILEALDRASREAAAEVSQAAQEWAAEQKAQERAESARESEKNKSEAESVYNPKGSTAPVPRELAGARQPTGAERSAAVVLARELEKARYRERDYAEYEAELPPGRFSGGEAMRREAARWANAPVDRYKPFTRRDVLTTDEPSLTVGIMSDISGSMKRLQPGIGVANYVISEAVYRLGNAKAAGVYFGDKVYPGLRKGERQHVIRTWEGGGAYEEFDKGFRALDGELDLLNGYGARLLIVASDGEYKTGPGRNQVEMTKRWLRRCAEAGVAVVWLQLRGESKAQLLSGMERVVVDGDILSASRAIGLACARALEAATAS